ncbi:MAG: DUF6046 domain-containing protein [Tannerella sp.]|jgi:hypothetical protein|nr:DUF6046 domain-containing protein [Tannerella sp.]
MTGQDRNGILFTADIIRHVFGINSPVYVPWGRNVPYVAAPYETGGAEATEKTGGYSGLQLLPEDSGDILYSEFGVPVLGAITFEAGEYNTYSRKTGAVEKVAMEPYTLPYSCIATFSRDSNTVKTDVLGSTGTVKEIYGKGDWEITVRGIAMARRNGGGATAQEQIARLIKWNEICDSIPVVGSIFREKGISNIVMESLSIQPVVGRWNAIPFQIEAVSDEPVELYLL